MAKPPGAEIAFQPSVSCPWLSVAQSTSSRVVGQGVWEAGVALIFWLAKNSRFIAKKRVLELGAGCGQTGVAAAALGASLVVVTDLDEVLTHLSSNVERNRFHLSAPIFVERLAWGNEEDIVALQAKYSVVDGAKDGHSRWDTIIAADCCYSEGSVPLLMATLGLLCTAGTTVIMAHDDRNSTATEMLEVAMRGAFDNVKRIPLKKINACMPSLGDKMLLSDGSPVGVECGESMHLYVLRIGRAHV